MENNRIRIGNRIRDIRQSQNLSQQDLADQAEITRANISRIEAGKYSPGLDVLSQIAEALNCEIDFKPKH